MPDIKVKVRNLEQVKKWISALPRKYRGAATKAMAEWFIGTGQRGLKRYPPYKYVSRKSAYGKTFVSDKQRRYVMAKIREGRIDPGVPHRTGNYQRGWNIQGEGVKIKIVNQVPYAQFVGGDETQARLNKKVGWRTISVIISTNIKGAIRHAEAAINKITKGTK
jgi:hypothetical protein